MSELPGYAEETDEGQVRCTFCGNEAGSLALLQHDCIYANDLVADGGRVEDADTAPQGPKYRCKNGSCNRIKPRTTVHESERKTLYRCPGCSRVLNADWNDGGEGDD